MMKTVLHGWFVNRLTERVIHKWVQNFGNIDMTNLMTSEKNMST